MEFEFDKEMDSLLRQTARRKDGVLSKNFDAHVDADEISLFAENALSMKARVRMTEHLADCDRCRKILSGVIALNAETESENVHAKEFVGGSIAVTESALPWYKKLFAFPQLAFAMGALALALSGVIGFLILKNATDTQNSSVAQVETASEASKTVANSTTAATENYSLSNTITTNSTLNESQIAGSGNTASSVSNASNTTTAGTTTAPVSTGTSNMPLPGNSTKRNEAYKDLKPETLAGPTKSSDLAKKEDFVTDFAPLPAPKRENDSRADNEDSKLARQQAEITQSSPVQNQATIMPDTQNARRSAPMSADAVRNQSRNSIAGAGTTASTESASETKEKSSSSRNVGGKTFSRANNVWYDSAYKGGATTNVRRRTDEYEKLDVGLRSIAQSLSGTIVVIWKGKAYRIQ